MCSRNGGGVDDQRVLSVLTGRGNQRDVFLVMYAGAFLAQSLREIAGRTVVSRHGGSAVEKVSRDGAHADASDTDKIDGVYV